MFSSIMCFSLSARSRTLGALVVPNIPILWIKTLLPLIQHGAKRVPRTQSSLNRKQRGYETSLNGHLPRSGKLPKSSTIYSSSHEKRDLSIWSLIYFYHYLHGPCNHPVGINAILVDTGDAVFEGASCGIWTHTEKPTGEHYRDRIRGYPFKTMRDCRSYYSGFLNSLGLFQVSFPSLLGEKCGCIKRQCIFQKILSS